MWRVGGSDGVIWPDSHTLTQDAEALSERAGKHAAAGSDGWATSFYHNPSEQQGFRDSHCSRANAGRFGTVWRHAWTEEARLDGGTLSRGGMPSGGTSGRIEHFAGTSAASPQTAARSTRSGAAPDGAQGDKQPCCSLHPHLHQRYRQNRRPQERPSCARPTQSCAAQPLRLVFMTWSSVSSTGPRRAPRQTFAQ